MGKAIPVELPNLIFQKMSDATRFFKSMLGRYSDGQTISEEDSILLAQLLLRHPDDKIGVGVDYFYRAQSPSHPTSSFHLMRINGEWTDFSYPRCVSGKKPTIEDYFYRACRSAVSPYLTEKKNSLFAHGLVPCSETGIPVTKDTSEYRHTNPSFKRLVDTFLVDESIRLDWSLFPPDRDRQYNVTFQDPDLDLGFIGFHKAHARLAIFIKRRGPASDL